MPSRTYLNDFLAGVDPTGTKTFQYGLQDATANNASRTRQLVGTAGGLLGGAAVVPGAIGGVIGGIKGALLSHGNWRKRLVDAGRGALKGIHSPYTSIYRGVKARQALAARQAGRTLTPSQSKSVLRFAKDYLPPGTPPQVASPTNVATLINRLRPEDIAKMRHRMGGEIGGGIAALGLSGLVSGGSAYAQYGKGSSYGEKLRRSGSSPGLLRNLQ